MHQHKEKMSMIQSININPNTNVQLPTPQRNYAIFDQYKVDYFVAKREQALPHLKHVLRTSNDEKEIVESLYIIDRMLDNKVKGIPHMYPIFAKLNDTKSPNIQTYLAGIYRKTQVPDAFGPLVKMLITNSTKPKSEPQQFDPNEEIGGAILEYISNYSKGAPKIDYTA